MKTILIWKLLIFFDKIYSAEGKSLDKKTLAINIENATVMLDQKVVLDSISLKTEQGEKCFILGANGAGKTTLVKTILGYIWPLYGAKVEVLGNLYGSVNLNELRKKIAWVSPFIQQHLDKSLTGLDTVLSGPDGYLGFYHKASSEELKRAEHLLKNLNALHLANKSILEMSSGQQMKILIARALLTQPELMIFDEPNVYLDIAEREFVLKIIKEIADSNPNLTMIFISQRIEDILPEFTRGIILDNGKISAYGTREEILTENNLSKAFNFAVKLIRTKSGRFWAITD